MLVGEQRIPSPVSVPNPESRLPLTSGLPQCWSLDNRRPAVHGEWMVRRREGRSIRQRADKGLAKYGTYQLNPVAP